MSRPLVFCAIVACVFAFAPPPADASASAAKHTIHGTVSPRGGVPLEDCAGGDERAVVHEGTRIRVEDGDHHVIARTELGAGRAGGEDNELCRYGFTVRDVPSSPTYTFLVAGRSDGRTITRARLAAHDWRITLKPS